jgi:hypothetical protein
MSSKSTVKVGNKYDKTAIMFYVDKQDNYIRTHYAKKDVIFRGIIGEKIVLVQYLSSPINRREDYRIQNTVMILYDVHIDIVDLTNPSTSFEVKGTLVCETRIPVDTHIPNYYASIIVHDPSINKFLCIKYL